MSLETFELLFKIETFLGDHKSRTTPGKYIWPIVTGISTVS